MVGAMTFNGIRNNIFVQAVETFIYTLLQESWRPDGTISFLLGGTFWGQGKRKFNQSKLKWPDSSISTILSQLHP